MVMVYNQLIGIMRSTFAIAALAAVTQANTMDVKAMTTYAAGFIYGLTGDDHQVELAECYTSTVQA